MGLHRDGPVRTLNGIEEGGQLTIRFTCPNRQCNRSVGAPDALAGQEARCPYCQQVVRIPTPPGKEPSLGTQDLAGLADGITLEQEPPPSRKARAAAPAVHMQPREKASVCPRCGTVYPTGLVCPQCRGTPPAPSRWETIPVGKILSMLVILAVLAGLAVGVMWLAKQVGQMGGSYGEAVMDARQTAYDIVCLERLHVLGQDIQMQVVSTDKFPGDLAELNRPDLLRCPAPDGQTYTYVPGQKPSMPPSNILVYEVQPGHEGRHGVLRLGGAVEMLSTVQLEADLARTQAAIARGR